MTMPELSRCLFLIGALPFIVFGLPHAAATPPYDRVAGLGRIQPEPQPRSPPRWRGGGVGDLRGPRGSVLVQDADHGNLAGERMLLGVLGALRYGRLIRVLLLDAGNRQSRTI
jgi:hypothetical protein